MSGAKKERLDVLMVSRGLAQSRERAQALIRAGEVVVGEGRVDKPGTKVPGDAPIRLKNAPCPYVSRGGYKLAGALDQFQVDPSKRNAVDIGASTGGFTDVLLQRGITKVFAVDVGYNQLAYPLRIHEQVVSMERVNFRHLETLPEWDIIREGKPDLAVSDVSFISLKLILPVADRLLSRPADVVTLVKPQFEVGREKVGKGGIVRDAQARQDALDGIVAFCEELGWEVVGTMESPITGTQGNIEFLLHARLV